MREIIKAGVLSTLVVDSQVRFRPGVSLWRSRLLSLDISSFALDLRSIYRSLIYPTRQFSICHSPLACGLPDSVVVVVAVESTRQNYLISRKPDPVTYVRIINTNLRHARSNISIHCKFYLWSFYGIWNCKKKWERLIFSDVFFITNRVVKNRRFLFHLQIFDMQKKNYNMQYEIF